MSRYKGNRGNAEKLARVEAVYPDVHRWLTDDAGPALRAFEETFGPRAGPLELSIDDAPQQCWRTWIRWERPQVRKVTFR